MLHVARIQLLFGCPLKCVKNGLYHFFEIIVYFAKLGAPNRVRSIFFAVFWAHEDSPQIHPVGWAKSVGQKLDCSPQYYDRVMKGIPDKDDATPDLFIKPERPPIVGNCYFQEGMKLEAIDPLNLSDICVATVMQVSFFTKFHTILM